VKSDNSFSNLDIRGIQITDAIPPEEYYSDIPVVKHIIHDGGIELTKPITIFVGENGIGKSSLIEAVAVAAGFNPEGGTKNFSFTTNDSHSSLCEHIRLVRGLGRHSDGFFLRAESFYNAASYLDELSKEDFRALLSYGGVSLHKMSHGESFLALVENRFSGDGLYILDEPEAAISPMRLMRLMVNIHELVQKGAQFIIATHSPILLTLPDADIIQITEKSLEHVAYWETEHFLVTKEFVLHPERMQKTLFDEVY